MAARQVRDGCPAVIISLAYSPPHSRSFARIWCACYCSSLRRHRPNDRPRMVSNPRCCAIPPGSNCRICSLMSRARGLRTTVVPILQIPLGMREIALLPSGKSRSARARHMACCVEFSTFSVGLFFGMRAGSRGGSSQTRSPM